MWKHRTRGMSREGHHGRRTQPVRTTHLELCDLCAAVFPASEAVSGYVPDSSSTHPTDDWFDGLRRVTACSDAHLDTVMETYRRRPFVKEELWAAKITRALTSGPPVLTMDQLACRTGLHEPDIQRAIAWHNEHRTRRAEP